MRKLRLGISSQGGSMPRGGYTRGALSATALYTVGFIIYSTAMPVSPFPRVVLNITPISAPSAPVVAAPAPVTTPNVAAPSANDTAVVVTSNVVANPATTSPLAPATIAPANLGGFGEPTVTAAIGGDTLAPSALSPTIRAPSLGGTSSGLTLQTNTTSQAGAPTLPKNTLPTLLGESQTNGQANLAINATTTRPTGGFDVASQSISAPSVDGTIAPQQAAETAALVAITGSPFPPLPAIPSDGAFSRNAQAFSDSGFRPLISVVLHVDSIAQAAASAGLAASVTLAVDANNPNAQQIIAAYRNVGGESLLLLPDSGELALQIGDTPELVKQKLKEMLHDDLRVIGVMDISGNAVPSDPEIVDSVLRVLAPWGHAIITPNSNEPHPAGLVAREAGLPTTSISTDIVADGNTILAELDRTARGISTSGSAVIYGNADDATIAALGSWLTSPSAASVVMAPVSASIKRN